jgi:hypothetical protein
MRQSKLVRDKWDSKRLESSWLKKAIKKISTEQTNTYEPRSGEAMSYLMTAARVHKLAVIGVMQWNKDDGMRGSTAFEHDADHIFVLRRTGETFRVPTLRQLEYFGRLAGRIPEKMVLDLRKGGYVYLGAKGAVKTREVLEILRELVAEGQENKVWQNDVIPSVAKEANVSEQTVKDNIARLIADDEFGFEGGGKGNKKYIWRIPGAIPKTDVLPDDDIQPSANGQADPKAQLETMMGGRGDDDEATA